ncbi:PAS domain S-box protein [Massilia sp. CF038]|uniref:PAS domain S-box protein n=1 Tax=Massilia sp. CF038 TaxID=1881045 RepID=UPI0009209197|nr:PAS domain S-box protein [Massilia sp. CF038]SHG76693.1 PAS domain S-box-containing protein [Massilia sp. CF038]
MVPDFTHKPDAFRQVGTAVARFDRSGVMTYANQTGLDLLGVHDGEHVDLALLFPDAEQLRFIKQQLAERLDGKSAVYQTAFRRPHDGPDASAIPVCVHAVPDARPSGEVTGSLVLLRDMRIENARAGIHQAIELSRTNEALFARVVEQLRTVFDFDEFRVTAVSQSRQHLRTVYSTDPQAATKYPFRWWPMPTFILETLDQYVPDVLVVETMRAEPHYQDLIERDATCRAFFESGVKQILSLPITRGNRIIGFVALDSRVDGRYDETTLALLMALPIAEAVVAALNREQRKRHQSALKLIRQVSKHSDDVLKVADTLVRRLQSNYGWDHVSVFQAEGQQLRLICQASHPAMPRLPEPCVLNWLDDTVLAEQPSRGGVMSLAARSGKPVIVENTRSGGVFPSTKQSATQGSEVAIAISANGLQWVLNAESRLSNAFATEEIDLLKILVSEAGGVLARSAMIGMQNAVLNAISDAVFETDLDGEIRSTNPAASRLLGVVQEELVGRTVFEFINDKQEREVWRYKLRASATELVLRRDDGRQLSVSIEVTPMPQQLGGLVYVVTDLTTQKEVQRLNELKVVFRQAAMEGRVPLALAATWLQLSVQENPETREAIEKVTRQLARADLPLERLMRLSAAEHRIVSRPYADMRQAVFVTLSELPRNMVECLNPSLPSKSVPVAVLFDDLQFCIESFIAFGIRSRPLSKMLDIHLEQADGIARFVVEGDWVPALALDDEPDAMDRWRRKSISDLLLGNSVIERIAQKYGGAYRCDFEQQCRMEIEFPQFAEPGARPCEP